MEQNYQSSFDSFAGWRPPEIKNAKYFRKTARALLKGKWVTASAASFVYMLMNSLVMIASMIPMFAILITTAILSVAANPSGTTFIPFPFSLFFLTYALLFAGMVLVGAPLSVGYMKIHLDVVDGKPVSIGTLFSYFKICYRHSVGAYFRYVLRMLGAVLIPIAAFFVYNLILYHPLSAEMRGSVLYSVLMGIGVFGTYIATVVLMLRTSYRYIMVFFLLAEHPELRSRDALRRSAEMMKGNKARLLRLHLSFFGWMLLLIPVTFITCGIGMYVGMFVLYAYILTATAAFYTEISGRTAEKEAEESTIGPNDYFPDAPVS